MSNILLLRFLDLEQWNNGGCPLQWQSYDAQGRRWAGAHVKASLSEAPTDLPTMPEGECRTIVLLPGHSVSVKEATISRSHVRHLRNAVIHSVEDHLAQASEEVHVAIGKGSPAGATALDELTYHAGIIHEAWMRQLMQWLALAGIKPDLVTSEALLLPVGEGRATLLVEETSVLFRLSPSLASSLEPETFLIFFASYIASDRLPTQEPIPSALPMPQTLDVWAGSRAQAGQMEWFERLEALCKPLDIAVIVHLAEEDTLGWLHRQWRVASPPLDPIDFLQGPYRPKGHGPALAAYGKPLALVLGVWLVLQIAFNFAMAFYLGRQADRFHERSVALYRSLFPESTKIVDLKAQMSQHLQGNAGGSDVIPLLGVLSGNADLLHRLDIRSLAYDGDKNELVADVTANDFTVFSQYRQLGGSSFAVDIGSSVRDQSGVHGQITIRRR